MSGSVENYFNVGSNAPLFCLEMKKFDSPKS